MKIYYFDNAATTRVDPEILEKTAIYNTEKYFNPSSLTKFSLDAAKDVASARKGIAQALGCSETELVFTSGGTESANTAILGSLHRAGGNIVTSKTEHSAVYNCVKALENKGYEIRFADVRHDGGVDEKDYESKIDSKTLLTCIMHVNNETGAVNVPKRFSSILKAKSPGALYFCDGTQAVGKIPVSLAASGADLYAFSGHKFHAPKGIGGLFIKKGVNIGPLHFGGGQERGLRPGTENVSGIVAMGLALQSAVGKIAENSEKFRHFREILIAALEKTGGCLLLPQGSPAIMCFAFEGLKSQVLSNMLEEDGIIIGLGSACSSKNKQNRVMQAIGMDKKHIEGVVRVSFSKYNTAEEVEFLARKLSQHVSSLRKLK